MRTRGCQQEWQIAECLLPGLTLPIAEALCLFSGAQADVHAEETTDRFGPRQDTQRNSTTGTEGTTMRLHINASGRVRRLAPGMTMTAVLAVTLAACSSSASSTTHVTSQQRVSAAASAAAPAASSPAPAAGDVSGKWSGQYSGSYQGTFHLHWLQSGSKLKGSIQLSNPGTSLPINGSVVGNSIRFGTVGSYGITYTGTVSGSSMSGTYKVANGNGSGGDWNASKP
jgi:hypothetical protein